MAETEHDAYLELRRQCDSLIAEMADVRRERDEAQAERDKAKLTVATVSERLSRFVNYNHCEPANECWKGCCDAAREAGRQLMDDLRAGLGDVQNEIFGRWHEERRQMFDMTRRAECAEAERDKAQAACAALVAAIDAAPTGDHNHIQFEGCTVCAVAPEDLDALHEAAKEAGK